MPLRTVPGKLKPPRHAYDRHPTPKAPIVRVYPALPWLHRPALWVRDDGNDTMDQNIISEFHRGGSHFLADDEFFGEDCDICKKRKAVGYDDFFGNYCPMCYITHPLRWKQRGINPWTGAPL